MGVNVANLNSMHNGYVFKCYIMQFEQLGMAWCGHNCRMSNTSEAMTGGISVIYIYIFHSSQMNKKI